MNRKFGLIHGARVANPSIVEGGSPSQGNAVATANLLLDGSHNRAANLHDEELVSIIRLPPMPRSSNEENQGEGPYALVLATTREILLQIEDETVNFADCLGIKVVSIVGGQSIEEQWFKIGRGCEVVIATPGRLIDCLERRNADLNQCNHVVLYVVNRMIDMGFGPIVVGVLDAIPSGNLKPMVVAIGTAAKASDLSTQHGQERRVWQQHS
ncbi:hypothetical protein Vadar_001127 [Vaccinium darrowii]|uniref:Uncharacterized protein n=1 Tax=Vaccinium darrowii TaxID=229202 RepID=A0ACB7XMA0_9ERIC|nr:hypothetical protein Vadar_001127 [Vaccinium darrowii]